MRKTPKQMADESIALTSTLLETQSMAETGLTLTGALISLLLRLGLERPRALDALGKLFAASYYGETEQETEQETERNTKEDPCTQ